MSAGGGDGEGGADGEGYGADQQGEDDQINEMMAGSDAELQVGELDCLLFVRLLFLCEVCSHRKYLCDFVYHPHELGNSDLLSPCIWSHPPPLHNDLPSTAHRCTSRWTWSTSRTGWPSGSRCTTT